MTRLSPRKLEALNLAIQEVYSAAWDGKLIEMLPRVIARLLPGDLAIGNLLTPAGMIENGGTAPALPNFAQVVADFSHWGHEHPTLGRRPEAQCISDHHSRRSWQRTGLFAEVIRRLEVEDDLGLDVALDSGMILSFCVWRRGWTFRPEERTLFDLLGPHVRQAWAQSERMKRTGLGEGLPESVEWALGHGVIRVDARGRVLEWSARTRAQLESFTGVPRSTAHLPAPLMAWFRTQCARLRQRRPVEDPHAVLRLDGENATLDVQFAADPGRDQYYLVLEEKRMVADPALLGPLGLSAREQEVLFWIAQGKANQAVGLILRISVHTVKRHLEKIYGKLGVDGRHAAAVLAREWFDRDGKAFDNLER
jgi:DNA-binding CsgD family transcriptional regulator